MSRDSIGQDRGTKLRLIGGAVLVGVLALWPSALGSTFARLSTPAVLALLLGGMLAVGGIGGAMMPFWWAIRVIPTMVIGANTAEVAREAIWPGDMHHEAAGWFFAIGMMFFVVPSGVAATLVE